MVDLWLEQFSADFFNLRDVMGPLWPLCRHLEKERGRTSRGTTPGSGDEMFPCLQFPLED